MMDLEILTLIGGGSGGAAAPTARLGGGRDTPFAPPILALFIGPVSGWNRKRSPFMSALGDIIATKMHASDDTILNISCN